MENLKGMFLDGKPVNAPYGTWAYAKNILVSKGFKSITNEYGFLLDYTFVDPIIGVIPTNRGYLVFTTNNIRDSIFYCFGTKQTVVNNNTTDFNFSLNYPIEGVFKFNNLDELIVAWCDNNETPKILNITKILNGDGYTTAELFPKDYGSVISENVVDSGGNLLSGAYYFTGKKITAEGLESRWEPTRMPVFITDDAESGGHTNYEGCEAGTPTNKSIELTITPYSGGVFAKYIIGIVTKINGIISFYKLEGVEITNNTPFVFNLTSLNNISETDIAELIVDTAVYEKAKTIDVLNDNLYLGNLKTREKINYQKYANNIKITYRCEFKDITAFNDSSKLQQLNHDRKTFMPREVYNIYIFLYLIKGGVSEFYHIPGREFGANDRDVSLLTNTGFVTNPMFYEVEDTCNSNLWDDVNKVLTGEMGVFENKNQTYANEEDSEIWDATGQIGDLAGENVRFHRFPSSKFLYEETKAREVIASSSYVTDNYGKTVREVLGIDFEDVYIPDDIKSLIYGYGFAFAKRDVNNMTVLGNDWTQLVSKVDGTPDWYTNVGVNNTFWDIFDYNKISSNCLDLLKTKPAVTPDCILNEFRIALTWGVAQKVGDNEVDNRLGIDYTKTIVTSGTTVTTSNSLTGSTLSKIKNFQYIPNDYYKSDILYVNYSKQENIYFELEASSNLINYTDPATTGGVDLEAIMNTSGDEEIEVIRSSYYSFVVLKDDIYQNYKTISSFVLLGELIDKDDTTGTGLFFGDCFASVGSHIQHALFTQNFIFGTIPSQSDVRAEGAGEGVSTYLMYYYTLISANNWGLRHKTTDELSSYYPKYESDITLTNNPGYYQWLNEYNDDYSSLNDLLIGTANNSANITNNLFPYRIAIGLNKGQDTDFSINWADFLANNIYEMLNRNNGEIWKIVKYGEQLLIFQKYSLYLAGIKNKLVTNIENLYVADGELFEKKPTEVIHSVQGYTGNQSQWATCVCKLGVAFIDRYAGKVFIFNGQLDEISSKGVRNFLRAKLNTTTDIDNPFIYNGLCMSYDNQFERLIISKLEYTPLFGYTTFNAATTYEIGAYVVKDNIYYEIQAGTGSPPEKLYINSDVITSGGDGVAVALDFNDAELFTNNSFTLSYSPMLNNGNGGWICFHDYYPNYMFNNRTDTLAVKNKFNSQAHRISKMNNVASKATYFTGDIYKSYFDNIFNNNPEVSKYLVSVKFDVDINTLEEQIEKVLEDETLTHIMVYNDNQCSGEVQLVSTPNFSRNNRNNRGTWFFNEFRDLIKDRDLAFIDDKFEVITSNIDTNKAWFNQNQFVGKFVVVRFIYDNIVQRNIDINEVNVNIKI